MSRVSTKKGKLVIVSTITANAIKTPVILCEAGHVEDKEWLVSNPPACCPHIGCGKPLLPELHKIPTASRFWKLLRLKVRKFREQHAGEMPVIKVKAGGGPVTRVVHYVFLDATTSMRWADGSITGFIPIPYVNPSRFERAKETIKTIITLLEAQSKATKIPQQVILSIFGAGQPIQVFPNPRQDRESPAINDVLDNVSASFPSTALFDAMQSAADTIEREAKLPENETVRYEALFVSDCNDTCSLKRNREAFEKWVKQTNRLQVITGILDLSQNHGGDDNIGKELLFQLDEHLRFYKVVGEQDDEDLAMEYWNKQKDLERLLDSDVERFSDLTDYTPAINTCPVVPTHTPVAARDFEREDEVELV